MSKVIDMTSRLDPRRRPGYVLGASEDAEWPAEDIYVADLNDTIGPDISERLGQAELLRRTLARFQLLEEACLTAEDFWESCRSEDQIEQLGDWAHSAFRLLKDLLNERDRLDRLAQIERAAELDVEQDRDIAIDVDVVMAAISGLEVIARRAQLSGRGFWRRAASARHGDLILDQALRALNLLSDIITAAPNAAEARGGEQ